MSDKTLREKLGLAVLRAGLSNADTTKVMTYIEAALADSADAPEGPWEELIKAATLYISALKHLIEGHHRGDGWERLMAIRDSVKVQEERWENALGAVRDALNRLDAQEKP